VGIGREDLVARQQRAESRRVRQIAERIPARRT